MLIRSLLLFSLWAFTCSCSDSQHSENYAKQTTIHSDSMKVGFSNFTKAEEDALDALDDIQVSGWQLYSTFPNIPHDCSTPIKTYQISQSEFRIALLQLLNQYYTHLPTKERTELATIASKAQIKYNLTVCGATFGNKLNENVNQPPTSGIWIFEALLDQRDLIIKW